MIQISVCIGSSCHLKGAYSIIEQLKRSIGDRKLEGLVELRANFCVGKCTEAVSVKVNDDPCRRLTSDEVGGFLLEVLGGISHGHHQL